MAMTKVILAQALVALSTATWIPSWSPYNKDGYTFPPPSKDPYCEAVQNYPIAFQQASPVVSAYCTKFFGITTTTATETAQVTQPITSTVNGVATTTITSTPTSFTSTQTCFQNTATANPPTKRWLYNPDPVAAWYEQKDEKVYKACSCFGVDFAPATTATSTSTIKKTVATTTKITATSTVTATSTAASNQVKTVYVPSDGTYTSTNGTNQVFTNYKGYDFYGGDLFRGQCQAGVPSEVDTSVGWFEYCVGYDSCLDICNAYNQENAKQANPDSPCVGVSYDFGSGFCYLKSAVPGNGAPNCQPHPNANLESAILGLVTTP